MTPERWLRVKELFDAALEREPDARARFLSEATPDDPSLASEVAGLLVSDQEAGAFLSAPPLPPSLGETLVEPVPNLQGRYIGPYRVLGEIGRGGMGTVYRAVRDDDQYQKQVAIKLVRGGTDAEFVLQRFRTERQILANLEHPNIARLVDGGTTEEGWPYFSMEYVEGQPIDRYCVGLGVRERLDLFRTVCAAVQYAHQRLVIHRDLKPSNIFVSADGIPKLLDFGIAKLLGADAPGSSEATAWPLMTPEYASPEQVKGEAVTTATDVYSLGMLLYELLARKRPYEIKNRAPEEVARVVCQQQPEKPSAVADRPLSRQLRGDLDTIVLKAIRKEPARRYQTVGELSEDLHRYLAGLPVLARGDTVGYRTGKFVRRHRAAVAAGVLLVLSLVAGVTATLWQARLAQRRFDEARRLIHTVIFDIQPKMGAVPGTTALRKDLIESTLKYLEALTRDAGDSPALLRELASSYVQLARVQGLQGDANMGDPQAARRTLAEAEKLVARLLTLDPREPESLHEAVLVERALALSFLHEGEHPAAEQHARRAVELAERLVGIRPDFQAREDLADAHRTLANSADSVEAFGRSREIYESLLLEKPDEQRVLRNLSQVYKYVAGLHYRKSEYRAGLDLIGKARPIDEKLLAANPENPQAQADLTYSLNQLSWGYSHLGDLAPALAAQQESLAMRETMVARNPEDARAQDLLAYALRAIARLRRQTGDRATARRDYLRAHAIYTDQRARGYGGAYGGSELAVTELGLGELAAEEGRQAEACQWFRRSAAVYGELAARGAVLPNHREDAESARRAAAACGR